MVVGTHVSWGPTISISGNSDYEFCTWSPCGRFVAALAGNIIEIRNQLTFQPLVTLQPTEATPLLTGPLVYSPDGRSLACASNTAIVIWDIQTGGVVKEIVCGTKPIALVWSLDGRTLGTLERIDDGYTETHLHFTYDAVSGKPLFGRKIHSRCMPHLWAYSESFRVMTAEAMERYSIDRTEIQIRVGIFAVQSYPIKTQAFSIAAAIEDTSIHCPREPRNFSVSPTTSRVSVSVGHVLRIFQDRHPAPLLQEQGHFHSPLFSSDGSFFVASSDKDVHIWKYTSGDYIRWRELRCQDRINPHQFSPIPSSILSYSKNVLRVWRLQDLPINTKPLAQQYAALSRSGGRIATAYQSGTNITIRDPHSPFPSQLIDTGVCIEGFLFTTNVLLVLGSGQVVAWLLTEEGLANGADDDISPNYDDRIWAIPLTSPNRGGNNRAAPLPLPEPKLALHVEGQTGVIEHCKIGLSLYHTSTGQVLQSAQTSPLRIRGPGLDIAEGLYGRHHRYCHDLPQYDTPPEGSWHPSETTLRKGWVKDPEGRHRLWLHVEWRKSWDLADWCHDSTTQFSVLGDQLVIIKF